MLIVDVRPCGALVCAWLDSRGVELEWAFAPRTLRLVCVGHRSG